MSIHRLPAFAHGLFDSSGNVQFVSVDKEIRPIIQYQNPKPFPAAIRKPKKESGSTEYLREQCIWVTLRGLSAEVGGKGEIHLNRDQILATTESGISQKELLDEGTSDRDGTLFNRLYHLFN